MYDHNRVNEIQRERGGSPRGAQAPNSNGAPMRHYKHASYASKAGRRAFKSNPNRPQSGSPVAGPVTIIRAAR